MMTRVGTPADASDQTRVMRPDEVHGHTSGGAAPEQASGKEDGDALATHEGHGPETTTTGEPR